MFNLKITGKTSIFGGNIFIKLYMYYYPGRIRTRDLQISRLKLHPLRKTDREQNFGYKLFNNAFKSPCCDILSLKGEVTEYRGSLSFFNRLSYFFWEIFICSDKLLYVWINVLFGRIWDLFGRIRELLGWIIYLFELDICSDKLGLFGRIFMCSDG